MDIQEIGWSGVEMDVGEVLFVTHHYREPYENIIVIFLE